MKVLSDENLLHRKRKSRERKSSIPTNGCHEFVLEIQHFSHGQFNEKTTVFTSEHISGVFCYKFLSCFGFAQQVLVMYYKKINTVAKYMQFNIPCTEMY